MGFDGTDNYAVVRSESSPSGSAPGLGFWINSGLKWVIDGTNNLKPWTDQIYNIGSFNSSGSGSGLRPGTVYVAGNSTSGSGLELGKFANESYELCNDTATGTIINGLAVLTASGCAVKPSGALTGGAIGIVIANAGSSGVATLARTGSAYCSFDATPTVVGDYVVPFEYGEQRILSAVSRYRSDAADGNANPGQGFAGQLWKRDGSDVSGYARLECEQQRSRHRKLHESGCDRAECGGANLHNRHVGVRGRINCTHCEPRVNRDTERSDGERWR